MQEELAEKLVEMMDDQGHEASIYSNYSGRGMYGKQTTGVVCHDMGTLLACVISMPYDLVDDQGGEPLFEPGNFRTDCMGTDMIIY